MILICVRVRNQHVRWLKGRLKSLTLRLTFGDPEKGFSWVSFAGSLAEVNAALVNCRPHRRRIVQISKSELVVEVKTGSEMWFMPDPDGATQMSEEMPNLE